MNGQLEDLSRWSVRLTPLGYAVAVAGVRAERRQQTRWMILWLAAPVASFAAAAIAAVGFASTI